MCRRVPCCAVSSVPLLAGLVLATALLLASPVASEGRSAAGLAQNTEQPVVVPADVVYVRDLVYGQPIGRKELRLDLAALPGGQAHFPPSCAFPAAAFS
jgi:hypothetical protein